MAKYAAVFERAEDGTWSGIVPDLPGVLGMGDTPEEAEASVREGIQIWIEDMRSRGHAIPEPSSRVSEVEAAA